MASGVQSTFSKEWSIILSVTGHCAEPPTKYIESFDRQTACRDLGNDAVSSADSLAFIAVRRRDELFGE